MSTLEENLWERIQSWYPDETLTDYELNQKATELVAFFVLGAKEAYRQKKERENSENNQKVRK